jgi:hypothetical protein
LVSGESQGEPPKTYEYVTDTIKELLDQMAHVSAEDIVASGGAAIGSPETLLGIFRHLAESGVDEVLLFMQMFQTPKRRSCARSSS